MRLTRRQRVLCRVAAAGALAITLGPPLHEAAGHSFAAHMMQHELLMLVAAPLIALGWPAPPVVGLVPVALRRRALGGVTARRSWRALTSPAGAWLLQAIVIWAWHVPALFDAAVRSEVIHGLEHMTFTGAAVLFWGSILRPRGGGYGAAVASVFTTALHTGALGALLTFMPRPLYGVYAGPGALADQQLAGLIMWVPAGAVFVAVGVAFGAAWLRESERSAARIDAHVMGRDA
jgi:putative membrane protein